MIFTIADEERENDNAVRIRPFEKVRHLESNDRVGRRKFLHMERRRDLP